MMPCPADAVKLWFDVSPGLGIFPVVVDPLLSAKDWMLNSTMNRNATLLKNCFNCFSPEKFIIFLKLLSSFKCNLYDLEFFSGSIGNKESSFMRPTIDKL